MTEGRENPRGGPVETLYDDYIGLVADLSDRSASGLAALNRSYHKHLLVAAASSLEQLVKQALPEIFARNGRPELGEFIYKRVMARGYHQLFEWDRKSAQGFFSSFGPDCGARFKKALGEDEPLKLQHDAFMLLGYYRNRVVHNDYANYPIDLTPEEVIESYRDALAFVDRLENLTLGTIDESRSTDS